MGDRRVRDPIHNLIKFSANSADDQLLWRLVETEPFQRLRRIRQLGFSEFVYPGACHTRFSHALGVMQMARRMLAALERNQAILGEEGIDTVLWRRATLCAALLHDVGHGPFSHVFEGISVERNIDIDHEDYTLEIIQNTKIGEVLRNQSQELFDATLSFFSTEPGERAYRSIVSGQLDADRLDFLSRDRYFCGTQFGQIDLEWLFDSLKIQKVVIDIDQPVEKFSFVVSNKGLSVIEEYLAAYFHMYHNVYFHKTTRGIEVLVKVLIAHLLDDPGNYLDRYPQDPVVTYFLESHKQTLGHYLQLDDVSVLSMLKQTAAGDFGEATELARRFFERKLFKCIEISQDDRTDLPRARIRRFTNALNEKAIKFFQDNAPKKDYKQFDGMGEQFLLNILVESRQDGEPRSIGLLSPGIKTMANPQIVRFYFETAEIREQARQIWRDVGE